MVNNSVEFMLEHRSMARPIPSVDLLLYCSSKSVGRKTLSFFLKWPEATIGTTRWGQGWSSYP